MTTKYLQFCSHLQVRVLYCLVRLVERVSHHYSVLLLIFIELIQHLLTKYLFQLRNFTLIYRLTQNYKAVSDVLGNA